MADDTAPPAPDAPPADSATEQPTSPETPEDWQDRAKAQQKVNRDLERKLKEAADKLKQIEDRDKTETQRAAERAETAERELATLRTEALRTRVALSTGLPAELADRLKGDDEVAMREDADRLLALVGKPKRPVGDIDQGKRGSAPSEDLDPAKLADAVLAQRGY